MIEPQLIVCARYPGESWETWKLTACGLVHSVDVNGVWVQIDNPADGDMESSEGEKRDKAEKARAKKLKKAKAKAKKSGKPWSAPVLKGCFWENGRIYLIPFVDVGAILIKDTPRFEALVRSVGGEPTGE